MREIRADPDAFLSRHPRMLVSFHKQSANQFPPTNISFGRGRDHNFHIFEDIAELRQIYRSRGCAFVLATMLRRPSDLIVSDYLFEGKMTGKSLPDFMGQDVQVTLTLLTLTLS